MSTQLFPQFPKTRPALPKEYQDIYVKEYKINREGQSFITKLSMKLENWLHHKIARGSNKGKRILELGAGTLNQLPFEKNYDTYDIVEPFSELYKDSPNIGMVNSIYDSIYEIANKKKEYDRIISAAVLEHVLDLPKLIAYSGLLLAEDGQFQVSIPSQGGYAWYATYNLTTGLAFYLRNKLNYNVLMNNEHVNTCTEIKDVIDYLFQEVEVSRFPIPIMHLSLYTYLNARKPNKDRCKQYLEQVAGI